MTSPSKAPTPIFDPRTPSQRRARRLDLTAKAATGWLLAQGLLYCALNEWLASHLDLRYMEIVLPYIRMAGLALLCLGLFLRASLRSPRHQVMTVDLLILMLLGQAFFTLSFRLSGNEINTPEWAFLAANLGLGALLTAFRTRSSEMDPASAGSLAALTLGAQARRLRQLRRPAKGTAPDPHPAPPIIGTGAFVVPEAPTSGGGPPALPPPGPVPPGSSSALPHMD